MSFTHETKTEVFGSLALGCTCWPNTPCTAGAAHSCSCKGLWVELHSTQHLGVDLPRGHTGPCNRPSLVACQARSCQPLLQRAGHDHDHLDNVPWWIIPRSTRSETSGPCRQLHLLQVLLPQISRTKRFLSIFYSEVLQTVE